MVKRKCEQCGQEFPMNETIRVGSHVVCDACCRQILAGPNAQELKLEREADPTICVNCGSDSGSVELPKLAGLPVCNPCETFFRNRPFPTWIKVSFAAVIALVVVSLVWNLRFFQAYAGSKAAFAAMARGNIETASQQMSTAASHVPECADLSVMATYLEGVTLLRQDRSAEGLVKLTACRNKLPPQFGVEALIAEAKCSAAFDAKDYDGFLAAAQTVEQQLPNDCMGKATVASAWACKYAQTGDTLARQNALSCLERARAMASATPEFKEYENRILHRLQSREIITQAEFARRFPNGWSPEQEK